MRPLADPDKARNTAVTAAMPLLKIYVWSACPPVNPAKPRATKCDFEPSRNFPSNKSCACRLLTTSPVTRQYKSISFLNRSGTTSICNP